MNRLSTDPRFAKLTVFSLDYDSGKEQLRQLKIRDRSTLVAYKGKTETARVVGDTDPNALQKLFEAAL